MNTHIVEIYSYIAYKPRIICTLYTYVLSKELIDVKQEKAIRKPHNMFPRKQINVASVLRSAETATIVKNIMIP